MAQAAEMRNLDVWYAHIEVGKLFEQLKSSTTKKQQAKAMKNLAKAQDPRQHAGVLQAHPEVDGQRRIVADPPLIVPIEDVAAAASGDDGRRRRAARA